jgi:hypothetical protein
MKRPFARLRSWPLLTLLLFAPHPKAQTQQTQPNPVRSSQGVFHGFLELRSEPGQILASGDVTQVIHNGIVTARTLFTFKDGSVDDETTVYTQNRAFRLLTDRHIQKGPSFPHPMDVLVDARTSQVTTRAPGKDGKEDVKTEHVDLPSNLANGLVPILIENLPPNSPGITVSMVVATPKPRLVKLVISRVGEDTCSVAGITRKATHYSIKIDLGGVAGVVAPIIGKQPPDIQLWFIGGAASTFAREQAPLYPEGPIVTIQLASPTWPDTASSHP